ncbi:MAG: hypothetical protein H7067_07640 [Burkholderiales bacterium]|nr:hypothetical protein [Opitutaceae bacterium]
MQAKTDTDLTFSGRVENLVKRLGDMTKVAEAMGISRQTLYQAMKGKVSQSTLKKLTLVELGNLTSETDTLEPQAIYGAHIPARAQLEARLRAVLDAAERVPGGLGWVSVQMGLHLRPEQLRDLDPTRAELMRRTQAPIPSAGGDALPLPTKAERAAARAEVDARLARQSDKRSISAA